MNSSASFPPSATRPASAPVEAAINPPAGAAKQPSAPKLPSAPERLVKASFWTLPRTLYLQALSLSVVSGVLMLVPSMVHVRGLWPRA
jgi:hypothetical protein